MAKQIEVDGTAWINWNYPEIYDRDKQDSLRICLYHTRAANDLTVKFDSERNGYVLYMDKTVCRDGWAETIINDQEVGFINAYNEDE